MEEDESHSYIKFSRKHILINLNLSWELRSKNMGREKIDPNVRSSIALLQERFRQLQRVKEMREERELLRLFSQAEHANPVGCYKPSMQFFHPDLVLPSRHLQGTLSLQQPDSQGKDTDFRDHNSLLSMTSWAGRTIKHSSDNFDMDVDTSLHL